VHDWEKPAPNLWQMTLTNTRFCNLSI
jgi:hypothetical protein